MISLPRKNTKEEFKERSQEPESRSQEALGLSAVAGRRDRLRSSQ
jgi:hypothetical protein